MDLPSNSNEGYKRLYFQHMGLQEQVTEMVEEISYLKKDNVELESIARLNKKNFEKMSTLYESSQKQLKSLETKLNNVMKELKEVNENYDIALSYTDIGKMEQEVKEIDKMIDSRKRKAVSIMAKEGDAPKRKRKATVETTSDDEVSCPEVNK